MVRIQPSVEKIQSYTQRLVTGLVGTDGVQYSSVATFGTTAVQVFNTLIDPAFDMSVKEIKLHCEQKFTSLPADSVGSAIYYWRGRTEFVNAEGSLVTGAYVPLTATYGFGVGTGLNVVPTIEGYFPVASLPNAPFRVSLMAQALVAAGMTGQVVGNSYVTVLGVVIS